MDKELSKEQSLPLIILSFFLTNLAVRTCNGIS